MSQVFVKGFTRRNGVHVAAHTRIVSHTTLGNKYSSDLTTMTGSRRSVQFSSIKPTRGPRYATGPKKIATIYGTTQRGGIVKFTRLGSGSTRMYRNPTASSLGRLTRVLATSKRAIR